MDDLLSEFLTETGESIATLDLELVSFEQNPNDKAILSNIFRLVHTIKGTCGFLGLPRLESLAHAGENVLGKIREGELEVTPSTVTLIFRCIDSIKEILAYIESNEVEPEGDDAELKDQLNALAEGREVQGSSAPEVVQKVEEVAQEPVVEEVEENAEDSVAPPIVEDEDSFPVAAELLAEVEEAYSQGKKAATEMELQAELEAEKEKNKPSSPKPPVPVAPKAVVEKGEKKDEEGGAQGGGVSSQSIRVNVDLLENLMTLVSELVLTRNQLLQMVRNLDNSEFAAPLQRLSHITTDLQEGVMKTRMQPIGNAWAKLPRIIRDLTLETGKKLDLQMIGAETELDRQILELIKDPLTHMVRNSADHGIEDPQTRLKAGKSEKGTITLNAYHEGGHIIVEIKDDGRGLNLERIKNKIIMNNLASEAELESMSEQQIYQYIFKAGFSTAEKITSVSGRGVGMDVVRTNVEKIGGTIELKSIQGKGSSFIIKIPLTLAIVSALIVAAGNERFAISQISVVELVRVTNKSEHQIELINNSPVLRLRNRLLPLVNLRELLNLNYDQGKESKNETFIVVSQVGTYTFGIIVDRVFDTEEIVVKPVAPILRNITMFSGNTILGDGSVIMILDPNGIAGATGETTVGNDDQLVDEAEKASGRGAEKTSMLIFKAGGDYLRAVPLALVARLEEIDISKIEHSFGKPVVQYRGQLMPLIKAHETTNMVTEGMQPILVFSDANRSMGLIVDEIVDIVEDTLHVELKADIPGVLGTAVINGKATDVVDTVYYLTLAFGNWFANVENQGEASEPSILIVDDSAFFRNLLSPLLSSAGYHVTAVESPIIALELMNKGNQFDLIVSDIEMPDMDGFEFAIEVKKSESWKSTPLIALSSHTTEDDFERGREVGFDDYVAKFDRDNLLKVIGEFLHSKESKFLENTSEA
ncbi:MAG: Chemotaxis protein CheA [Alphaproteobacteria bacterium ADurb.Bin438]|nr:MAG: Chemotaxis protein CheA [Alphaproteobacteria bacterium ADurb.Bin438]